MNTVSEQTNETRPSSSASHAARQSEPRSKNKESAAAESGFDALLSAIVSALLANLASQTPALDECAVHKTCDTPAAEAAASQKNVQPGQTASQNDELSTATQATGAEFKSSSSASGRATGGNWVLPAAPETGEQLSDTRSYIFLKELISPTKNINLSRPSNHESSPLPAGREGNQDSSSIPNKDAPTQRSADFSLLSGRETALPQQSAQNTGGALAADKMRPEGAGSTARAFNELDLNGNKAYISHDGNRLAVSLEPDGLGKLNINLSLDRGTVNAQIQATDPAAKNLLENNMQQIVNTLMHEGLTVGGFSVSLKHGEAGGANEQGLNNYSKSPGKDTADGVRVRTYDMTGRINLFV